MLIAVDKEKGITSFDVIRKIKPFFEKKTKIGHSGTLDPMATGLMLVGIYKEGTKMLHSLQGLSKVYETTIDFSKISDTWDLDYREYFKQYEIAEKNTKSGLFLENIQGNKVFVQEPTLIQIKKELDKLIPKYSIPLTPFSAKKKNGQKLYELARKGEFILENKEMFVHSYKIIDYKFPLLKVKFDVGSGTYIRSLGYWLGQQLGLGGILVELRRESIGDFILKNIELKEQFGVRSGVLIP